MAKSVIAMLVALQLGTQLPEPPPITLDAALVARIEQQVTMPHGAEALHRYERYYHLETREGREVVVGLFLLNRDGRKDGAIHLLFAGDQIVEVADGGCSVVNLTYDPKTRLLPELYCNGLG